ncbi:MAG: tripartite tricarboxylate transporter substrate-binding protein [Marinilabiliales bacterium]|nr:tripartite tricarboxylate transporter substrate-binding protein [Marinilabiliales bacterium]
MPHKGGAENLAALAGGHVNVAMASPNEAYALVQGGRVRCLANASLERSPTEPNAPTMRELGYRRLHRQPEGIRVPQGRRRRRSSRSSTTAVEKVFDDPQFKANADKLKLELSYLNGEDFRKALKSDVRPDRRVGEEVAPMSSRERDSMNVDRVLGAGRHPPGDSGRLRPRGDSGWEAPSPPAPVSGRC